MHFAAGILMVSLAVLVADFGSRGATGHGASGSSGSAVTVEERTVEVVVQIRRDIAAAFRNTSSRQHMAGAAELQAVLASFGVELKPLHETASDPELGSYFTISGLSHSQAERLTARLRELSAIESAFVQPSASPA